MGESDPDSMADTSDRRKTETSLDAETRQAAEAVEPEAAAAALEAATAGISTDPPTPATVGEQLTHVIDDTDGREEAVKWAENQLLGGATFEMVSAELVSQGWALASADAIVEEAREATRRQRGVRTRDDVVVGVYRKFGKTMRRVRWLIIIGIIIVVIAISMMMSGGQ